MDLEKTYVVGDVMKRFSAQGHFLVATAGALEGRHVRLGPEAILVGRAPDSGLHLPDPVVSGRHCTIRLDGARVLVADLGSTNGCFVDGSRIEGTVELPPGSVLQVGRALFRHEMLAEEEVRRREQMAEELRKASMYVQALLPKPLTEGPVRSEWRFIPSLQLGGDAFGHHRLSDDRLVVYLLDASGHGAQAMLHSVSVMNIVQKQSLPGVDFGEPGQVLTALNRAFPMELHSEVFFTIWYGVFDPGSRRLRYSSAGHPPALLVPTDRRDVRSLATRNPPIGIADGVEYDCAEVDVPPAGRLYVFSDGTFEVRTKTGRMMTAEEFASIVTSATSVGTPEAARIEGAVRAVMSGREFEDDFSLLTLLFD